LSYRAVRRPDTENPEQFANGRVGDPQSFAFLECGAIPPLWFLFGLATSPPKQKQKRRKSAALQKGKPTRATFLQLPTPLCGKNCNPSFPSASGEKKRLSLQRQVNPAFSAASHDSSSAWHDACISLLQPQCDGTQTEVSEGMSQRDANLIWVRDILEHLSASQKRLEWAEDPEAIRLITETMLRDLERCQRLCEALHRRCAVRSAV
jgi:hypothetical protein